MMRALALSSGRRFRRLVGGRSYDLGFPSLAPDCRRDSEKKGVGTPGLPYRTSSRSFSSVIHNGSSFAFGVNPQYFENQRRTLFGWGKAKEKTVEEPNASFPDASDEANVSSPDAAQIGAADETVFSAGSDPIVAQALSSVEPTSSFTPPFGSSPIQPEEEILKAATAAAEASSKLEGLDWSQDYSRYLPQDQVIECINYLHVTTGWSYAAVIAGLTCAIRVTVFPLFVYAQRNSSRMAHMKPEMDLLKARMESLGVGADNETKLKMNYEMRALFKKYECNPLKALIVPFVQLPLFVSIFVGLRKMPDYFPNELSTGGALWFPDLTAADPTWAMPIASGFMFVGMVELGKEQMLANNAKQGEIFLNVFRVMGVVVTAATINFPAAIFCYWMPNNALSVLQAVVFNNKTMRRKLGIWDLPAPVPGQEPKGIVESIQDAMQPSKKKTEVERIKLHNEGMERSNTGKRGMAGRKGRRGKRGRNNIS